MKNQSSTVNISAATLNALKQMLFSNENGVDLSSIVKDISSGVNGNEDLIAINVGLSFKGIKPEIDEKPRYSEGSVYWKRYERWEFISYSLILDAVKYKRIDVTREEKVDNWTDGEPQIECCSLSTWLNGNKSPEEYVAAINEKYPINPSDECAE